jgi:hypothetical protein
MLCHNYVRTVQCTVRTYVRTYVPWYVPFMERMYVHVDSTYVNACISSRLSEKVKKYVRTYTHVRGTLGIAIPVWYCQYQYAIPGTRVRTLVRTSQWY